MKKARCISFYTIKSAGYLSEEAYRALLPKTFLFELSFSDCYLFKPNITNELKNLFEDDSIVRNLYYLEIITVEAKNPNSMAFQLLNDRLIHAPNEVKEVVSSIGYERFLSYYAYGSDILFADFILKDSSKYYAIQDFVYDYRIKFEDYYDSIFVNTDSDMAIDYVEELNTEEENNAKESLSEPFDCLGIIEGKGFSGKDRFVVDDDALSPENQKDRRYVLFLYSINKDMFASFENYLMDLTKGYSNRLLNCLKALGLRNFYVNYLYASKHKLFQIRNFGRQSVYELENIKPKLFEYIKNEYSCYNNQNIEDTIKKELEKEQQSQTPLRGKLGENKYGLLVKKFLSLINSLSVRSRNCINNYNIDDFLEDFVNKNVDLKKIKNVGKKTEEEIALVIESIRNYLSSNETEELTETDIAWESKVLVYDSLLDKLSKDYYFNNGRLPMLHIVENYIRLKLHKKNFMILNYALPVINNLKKHSIEETANYYNLTRERVRQICQKEINSIVFYNGDLQDDSLLSKILLQKEDWNYIENQVNNRNIWYIDDLLSFQHNENSNLNIGFIVSLFANLFHDSFSLVGKPPFSLKTKRDCGWKYTYLINKKLYEAFDFEKMRQIIDGFMKESSEMLVMSTRELLIDLFSDAWKAIDFTLIDPLGEVISQILIREFELVPDTNLKFTIQGKKSVNPADILYSILKESGKPMALEKLYSNFTEYQPNRYKSFKSLRSVIKEDSRMCFVANSNQVSLMEWTHIALGSIRDLIVSFLSKYDEPQHISTIVSYITSIRNTSERSIRSTMISGDQFQQFSGGYFGLVGKIYSDCCYLSEAEKKDRVKIVELEQFLIKKQRFPYSTSIDKEEKSLYLWWKQIKSKSKVSDYMRTSILEIDTKYGHLPANAREIKWFVSCEKYKAFLLYHKRKPGKISVEETVLSNWFEKSLFDLSERRLSTGQETAFINLCQLL